MEELDYHSSGFENYREMGKDSVSSEQSTVKLHDENNPGCMWGILHVLDYHHWRIVRKVFPHKRRHRGRTRNKCKQFLFIYLFLVLIIVVVAVIWFN